VNLILIERDEVSATGDVTLSGSRAAHMLNVLRVAPGHQVRVGVLDGPRGTATVRAVADSSVELHCALELEAPPPPAIDLLLAVPRPKVMRRLWAQIAALGVGRIILTNAEKVERNYFDTHMLEPGTYRPLLIEGLQQAQDTHLPAVSIHRRFRVLIEDELDRLVGPALRIVADPSAATPLGKVVRERRESRILLAIGPEGGWNAFEVGLLAAHGFQVAGMGSRTLRTDTACIALLAIAQATRNSDFRIQISD
jgi:RsmE family RNA methyltransferase